MPQMTDSAFVNGRSVPLPEDRSVSSILGVLGYDRTKVAVEINGDICPRARFDEFEVRTGDVIEIVSFVGGG